MLLCSLYVYGSWGMLPEVPWKWHPARPHLYIWQALGGARGYLAPRSLFSLWVVEAPPLWQRGSGSSVLRAQLFDLGISWKQNEATY